MEMLSGSKRQGAKVLKKLNPRTNKSQCLLSVAGDKAWKEGVVIVRDGKPLKTPHPGEVARFRLRVQRNYFDCFQAFFPTSSLELDLGAFGKGFEACALDFCVVNKEILATIVRGDEAKPLLVVEPFDGSITHTDFPSFFCLQIGDSMTLH